MNHDRYFEKLQTLLPHAYVPYSHFRVACLLWTDKGWFYGVNVENAAYSPTICAERNAVSTMVTNGGRNVLGVWILTDSHAANGTPCGVCRQVLFEFAQPTVPVIVYNQSGHSQTYTVGGLLPNGFNAYAMHETKSTHD